MIMQATNFIFVFLFAFLAVVVTWIVVWGYKWRAGIRGWWTPLIQVVGDLFFLLHFLLLARRTSSPGALSPASPSSPQSPLVEATLWFGFASLSCWGIVSVGLWLRARGIKIAPTKPPGNPRK